MLAWALPHVVGLCGVDGSGDHFTSVPEGSHPTEARFLHHVDARSADVTLIDRGANVSVVNTGADGPFVVLGTIDGAPRVDVSQWHWR